MSCWINTQIFNESIVIFYKQPPESLKLSGGCYLDGINLKNQALIDLRTQINDMRFMKLKNNSKKLDMSTKTDQKS